MLTVWTVSTVDFHNNQLDRLRIPDSCDAKIAKFCNLWTFWPVIKLIKYGFLAELQVRMSSVAVHRG